MKKSIFMLAFGLISLPMMAQFPMNPTDEGSRAVAKTDPNIVAWAKGIEVLREPNITYGKPYDAVGVVDEGNLVCISLGNGGSAIATFDRPIVNGAGVDFAVFENAFANTFLELAFVEVSSDGEHFFRFPAISTATESSLTSDHYYNLAGKYEHTYGVGFDLDDLDDDANLDKNNIRIVRIVDVQTGIDTDSQGNIIYDAVCGTGWSAGFDLSGVAIINGGEVDSVATMNGLLTEENTYDIIDSSAALIGPDLHAKSYLFSGLTLQGLSTYGGAFNFSWGVSNLYDTNAEAARNDFMSSALSGVESEGDSYLFTYYSDYVDTPEQSAVYRDDSSIFYPQGAYVSQTLASASYPTMGGGTNQNWMKIVATGYDSTGAVTDSAEVYLIDYSADANGNVLGNYKEWRYLDLTKLGAVKKVIFKMESSYANEWGLLIPSYFCMDNFSYRTSPYEHINYDTVIASTCDNNPYEFEGQEYTQTGVYTANESVLVLTVYPTYKDTIYDTIAQGETYIFNDQNLNTTGEYIANLTSEEGCDSTVVLNLFVTDSSSLTDVNNIKIALYPNPATEYVTFETPTGSNIKIFNVNGEIIKEIITTDNKTKVGDLANGIYIATIRYNNNILTKKLIIQ